MIPEPINSNPFITGDQSLAALEALGLKPDWLLNAVLIGVQQAQGITPFHPVTSRGFTQWSETVAALRQKLVDQGWTMADPQNSPRITSPDCSSSILVIGGNDKTALSKNINPGTNRRRGPATVSATQCNGQQMFDLGSVEIPLVMAANEPIAWVLLYHWSKDNPQVRAELSLPLTMVDGHFDKWLHRILLPSQDLSDFAIPLRPSGPADDVDFRIVELK